MIFLQEMWKKHLTTKFKNTRQRRDKTQPEVITKKRKIIKSAGDSTTTVVNVNNCWNITNFLSSRPSTEDDASIERHVAKLLEQHKKPEVRRNPELIADAMSMTLADRRKMIVVDLARLDKIKDAYPILFDGEQVFNFLIL